jgi:Gpi18-like mannosyltransferase
MANYVFDLIPVIGVLANFDGIHYLNIATYGYTTEARFFPLFPLIIRLVSYILSLGHPNLWHNFFAAILISFGCFLGAVFFLYKLIRKDYSHQIARKTVLFFLIFPTAFFFVSVYSEGLFLLLLILCFYFAREKRWYLAILMGFLLCLTRLVGIFILPALLFEYIVLEKVNIDKKRFKFWFNAFLFLLIPLGTFLYGIFNLYKWNNFFYFLTAQGELGNSREISAIINPLQTMYRYLKILTSIPSREFQWWIALLEISSFLFGITILFIAWKKKIRTSYLIFGILAFLLPALSGTFSGLPRYLLIIFPLFIGLSLIESKLIKILYCTISPILLFLLFIFFARGYFIA